MLLSSWLIKAEISIWTFSHFKHCTSALPRRQENAEAHSKLVLSRADGPGQRPVAAFPDLRQPLSYSESTQNVWLVIEEKAPDQPGNEAEYPDGDRDPEQVHQRREVQSLRYHLISLPHRTKRFDPAAPTETAEARIGRVSSSCNRLSSSRIDIFSDAAGRPPSFPRHPGRL